MGRELDGKLVLVIEDHEETREGMVALLDDAGAIVESARGMEEALLILREAFRRSAMPDAIVCDMLLPDGNGIDLPRRVFYIAPNWHGPLVGLSAHPNTERAARRAGFDDFLPKLLTRLLPTTLAHLFREGRP